MKKNLTFNDFSLLTLKGEQKFLTYGEYVSKNRLSNREKRRLMITYHYKNIFDN